MEHDEGGHHHGVAQDADGVVKTVGFALHGVNVNGLIWIGIDGGLLQFQQVVAEGFLQFEKQVAVETRFGEADVGCGLLVEAAHLEVLQQADHLDVHSHGVHHAPHHVVTPVHHAGQRLVHNHLVIPMLQPFQAGHTAFQKGHAHEVGVVRTDLVEAGGEERIAALVIYHRAAVTHQGVAAGRHILHIGQGAEEVFGTLALLGCCERNKYSP